MPPRKPPSDQAGGQPQPGEVYVEFQPVGNAVRVTATDAATAIEVVAMGPRTAAPADLEQLALRKLKMRLAAGRH